MGRRILELSVKKGGEVFFIMLFPPQAVLGGGAENAGYAEARLPASARHQGQATCKRASNGGASSSTGAHRDRRSMNRSQQY